MVRRWAAVTPERPGGPEGRCRENREQRQREGQRQGTAFGHVTDDSQDGCRYTIKNGRCVATGFQPVGGRGSDRAQRQMPPRVGGKTASLGVPGTALCRIDPPARGAPCTMPYRAPPGRAMRSSVPATKQAAGGPSAGSQPFQFTTYATPPMGRRRAAEGGPEGRGRGKTPATANRYRMPVRPTISRIRDAFRCETDGQARRPPPQ